MQKSSLLLIVLLLGFVYADAQNIVITGLVKDKDNLSLPGATVKLLPQENYTYTDTKGHFEFLNVKNVESITIEVSYIGYQKVTKTFSTNNKNLDVTITLDDQNMLDEVVVVGDRLRGQMKALNQQKNGGNITNIVSADQVGRFPDANIGDALKRVPGITMQNDQGEARNIIVRGLASELNSVTLNGDRIPSAEGDNRKVQMDLIPSDMVQTIEVNKTLTPDMDADAIGGSVNLITRAPSNGQRISATVSGGLNPIRNGGLFSGGLVYGNRFLNNKLGMVLSGSYNTNKYGSDNVEAVWKEDEFGNLYMDEHDIRKYDLTRTRRSVAGAFDYKFNGSHRLTANAMYNWRDDWENRYRLATVDIEPVYDDNDERKIIGFTGEQRRQTKGGIDNKRVKSARLEQQTVQNYSLRGDHLFGSLLDMDWTASYSTAREYRPNERYIRFEAEDVDLSSDFGTFRQPLPRLSTPLSLADYELGELSENTNNTTEDEFGARINFRLPFSIINNEKGRLRFGARLRLKNKMRDNNFTDYEPIGNELENMAGVNTVNWDGKGWSPSNKYVPGLFTSREFLGGLKFNDATRFEAEDVPGEYLAVNYNAKENITAGYLRWDQDFSSKMSMIAGVRLENTSLTYTGNIVQDEDNLEGARTIKNSYLNVLPGLTFKYVPIDNFVLRAAATTALARPNYYTLSPFVSTVLDDNEITAGNPALKASYSWNFDLMAEYYFKTLGLISGGVFYKNIKDFIYTYRDEFYTNQKFANDFADLQNPISAGDNWTLIQARNGEKVNVYGLEVAFQRQLDFLPGKFLKGFGIYTNYTFTKSSAKGIYNNDGELRTGIMLPGTAPHMFNASLSWENKRFSARASLNYAAAYLDELGGNDFDDRYYDQQLFVDANASYKITKNLRFFAEANNLTNQALRYYQGVSDRTMQMEYYRQRYNFGLKLDITK